MFPLSNHWRWYVTFGYVVGKAFLFSRTLDNGKRAEHEEKIETKGGDSASSPLLRYYRGKFRKVLVNILKICLLIVEILPGYTTKSNCNSNIDTIFANFVDQRLRKSHPFVFEFLRI